MPDIPRIDRVVERNLALMPRSLHSIYADLVRSTLLLPEDQTKHLKIIHGKLLDRRPEWMGPTKDICFLNHGHCGLRQNYFRANRLPGRLDVNFPFSTVSHLLEFVALAASCGDRHAELAGVIRRLLRVDAFVVFSDLAITGQSLIGDYRTLKRILGLFRDAGPMPPVAAAICGASPGVQSVLSGSFAEVVTGYDIPMDYSLNHPDCPLGVSSGRWEETRDVVAWFRDFAIRPGDIVSRMEIKMNDPRIGLWGVGAEGWLIRGACNTPNNSLPLLWHRPQDCAYEPPFPRVSSRLYEKDSWNMNHVYWEVIDRHRERLESLGA